MDIFGRLYTLQYFVAVGKAENLYSVKTIM